MLAAVLGAMKTNSRYCAYVNVDVPKWQMVEPRALRKNRQLETGTHPTTRACVTELGNVAMFNPPALLDA
jgi:hypothetical protein